MNIANKIYGYGKGTAMGNFKDVASPVSTTIMEHYNDVHLDIDLLFVNKIPFFWQYQEKLDLSVVRHCFLSMTSACRTNYSKSYLIINQGDSRLYPFFGTVI